MEQAKVVKRDSLRRSEFRRREKQEPILCGQDHVSTAFGGNERLPVPYPPATIRQKRVRKHDAGVLRHRQSRPVRHPV